MNEPRILTEEEKKIVEDYVINKCKAGRELYKQIVNDKWEGVDILKKAKSGEIMSCADLFLYVNTL